MCYNVFITERVNMKVVYVEDEPDIQKVARMSLEKVGGFDVTIFNSGQEALSGVSSLEPDLFLLDVMMPGMSGTELFVNLRKMEKFVTTPIIFITAKTNPAIIQELKELGALAVITKPFDPMKLPSEIKSIINAS